MKKVTFFLAMMAFAITVFAQPPQAFKYQAIARDSVGNILINQNVSLRISILEGSTTGTAVYVETHNTITNDLGLFNLEIGNPDTVVSGDFMNINWSASKYFLQVELDVEGGISYDLMGISQLLSVPYSISSQEAEMAKGLKLVSGDKEYIVMVNENGELYTVRGGCDSLVDTRDGKVYQATWIGDQCWMAENLNYETDSSWCYNNDAANCEVYGRMYAHNSAVDACPGGWHLPDNNEWCTLLTYVDSTVDCNTTGPTGTDAGGKLKATGTTGSGGLWNSPNTGATDEYGFSGFPGGYYHPPSFWDMSNTANFWSATPSGPGWDHFWRFSYDDAQVHHQVEGYVFGFSVRCIRD